jgi:hypothetical protein
VEARSWKLEARSPCGYSEERFLATKNLVDRGTVTEQRMADVRCYAGASYPERPVAFVWEGQWLEVVEVLRQVRTPEGLLFVVVAGDGLRYRLAWIQASDEWTVSLDSDKMDDRESHYAPLE